MQLHYQQPSLQAIQITCPYLRLDSYSAHMFRSEVIRTVNCRPVHVNINLQNVEYMDSAGLSCLFAILNNVRANSGELTLHSIHEQVQRLFELASVDKVFNSNPVSPVS